MEILLPDGTALMHGNQPYDPVKAHEYYIKNRKLKGRRKGNGREGDLRPGDQRRKSSTFTVKRANGKTVKLSAQQLAEQKAYAAYRVANIKKKLAGLTKALREKMREAKESERKAAKPDTAAEKSEKARDSEKYRDKHKTELASKSKAAAKKESSKKPDNSVDGLKGQIADMKASLKAAVGKQRELAAAKKNG